MPSECIGKCACATVISGHVQEELIMMENGKRIRSAADVLKHLCENETNSSYSTELVSTKL